MRRFMTRALFLVIAGFFLLAVLDLPSEVILSNEDHFPAVQHYLFEGTNDTNATNLIASILADYRLFDTLGETIVLFTSIVAVASVLRKPKEVPDVR